MFPWDAPHVPVFRFTTDGRWKLTSLPLSKRWKAQLDRIHAPRRGRLKEGMYVKGKYESTVYQIWSPGYNRGEWWVVDTEGNAKLVKQRDLYIVKFTCQEA